MAQRGAQSNTETLYSATVAELQRAEAWTVTPDGPVDVGTVVWFERRDGIKEARFEVYACAPRLPRPARPLLHVYLRVSGK